MFNRDGDRYPGIRAGGAVSTADAGTASRVSVVICDLGVSDVRVRW